MHLNHIVCLALLPVALVVAFDPITLTIGTSTLALTGTQVALGVGGIAALAIVKEKLILADLSRRNSRRGGRRGRRSVLSVEDRLNLNPFFEALALTDVSDCGKKLVCSVMAIAEDKRNADQKRVANLFDDLDELDASAAHAAYQFAAALGKLGQPELCNTEFPRCPATPQELEQILEAHGSS